MRSFKVYRERFSGRLLALPPETPAPSNSNGATYSFIGEIYFTETDIYYHADVQTTYSLTTLHNLERVMTAAAIEAFGLTGPLGVIPKENTWVKDVEDFHEMAGLDFPTVPTIPSEEEKTLARRLILEEVKELLDAINADDMLEVADGIGDSIVVLIRAALAYGLPLERIMAAIHVSNISKFEVVDNRLVARFREDGKILKGPSFQDAKPMIASILSSYHEGDNA